MAPKQSELLGRLGARLRSLREDRRLTQEQVAERAGYSGKYISEIERGLRDLPLTTLERITDRGLGCTIQEALAGSSPHRTARSAERQVHEPRSLPRPVRELAEEIAGLSTHGTRGRVLALVRGILALTRRDKSER